MYSNVLSPLSAEQRQILLTDEPLLTLPAVFASIPDPRSKHGQRYNLPYLLLCLTAAVLCNCNSTEAVGQWCREQRPLLQRLFGPRLHLSPTASLYRRLLPRLSSHQIEWALARWVRATLTAALDDAVALDGKTVRGAASRDQVAPHLLAFRTHASQETLLQIRVSEKTNEIPVAQAVLPCLALRGRVYTADALHTQRAFTQAVVDLQGYYLLTVKENQPTLYTDLQTYFSDPEASCEQEQTIDRHKGRLEVRQIRVTTLMNAYLACWPGLAQVAQLKRSVTTAGKRSEEVVYLITNLSPLQASPGRLLHLIRGHWSIENGLHYVRDVTFQEDRSQLRTGHAPQILAALRNLVITLIHRQGSTQIAVTRRWFAFHPEKALAVLLSSWVPSQ
jgi:predicted transposase YbfD/YdcC